MSSGAGGLLGSSGPLAGLLPMVRWPLGEDIGAGGLGSSFGFSGRVGASAGTDQLINQLAETQKNALIFNKLVLDQSLRMALGKRGSESGTVPASVAAIVAMPRGPQDQPDTPNLPSVARPTINGATLLSAIGGKSGSASNPAQKKEAGASGSKTQKKDKAPAQKKTKKKAGEPKKAKPKKVGGGAKARRPNQMSTSGESNNTQTQNLGSEDTAGPDPLKTGNCSTVKRDPDGSVSERRRQQNRLASARFREKNKRSREAVQELGDLRAQNARLRADNIALATQLRVMNSSVMSEMRNIQEGTLNWVLSKFRLRRRMTLKTVATVVSALLALQRRAQEKVAAGQPTPTVGKAKKLEAPRGKKKAQSQLSVRSAPQVETPPAKKPRRQSSRSLSGATPA